MGPKPKKPKDGESAVPTEELIKGIDAEDPKEWAHQVFVKLSEQVVHDVVEKAFDDEDSDAYPDEPSS